MAKIFVGINMEFVRHHDKSFEWGVAKAAEIGYQYVEPMVHWGRELLSEAGYFHSVSMLDDPYRINRACESAGVKLSGLSAHTPLCKPEVSVEYLKQAVRFAAECGAPVKPTVSFWESMSLVSQAGVPVFISSAINRPSTVPT